MTPEALWKRYAAIWSLKAEEREVELAACLVEDATYCDPNGLQEGRHALSAYMGAFREDVPGGQFEIRSVLQHYDRSLADWSLTGPDATVLQTGTTFGLLSPDGRLSLITGFFHPVVRHGAI